MCGTKLLWSWLLIGSRPGPHLGNDHFIGSKIASLAMGTLAMIFNHCFSIADYSTTKSFSWPICLFHVWHFYTFAHFYFIFHVLTIKHIGTPSLIILSRNDHYQLSSGLWEHMHFSYISKYSAIAAHYTTTHLVLKSHLALYSNRGDFRYFSLCLGTFL